MIRTLFFGLSVAILFLSSCAPSRFTQDSGATNVLNVSLNDEGITYSEATVPLEARSWGGFLLGAKTEYEVDASIINNNNGANSGYLNASGGGNFLAVLTGVGEFLSIAGAMTAGSQNVSPIGSIFVGAISFFAAAAVNDAIWSGINQRRVQVQANTQIMDLTSDAHFYCMPQSQIVVQPGLFSTSWKGESSLIAGTIENVATIEGESMMSKRKTLDQSKGASVGTTSELIEIQPTELLGATGQYAVSKSEYVNFTVIEIADEGSTLSDCVIVIQFVNAKGQTEQKKVRASNDDLMYQSPGQK